MREREAQLEAALVSDAAILFQAEQLIAATESDKTAFHTPPSAEIAGYAGFALIEEVDEPFARTASPCGGGRSKPLRMKSGVAQRTSPAAYLREVAPPAMIFHDRYREDGGKRKDPDFVYACRDHFRELR